MLEPHPHLCNRAGFRDITIKSGNPGHNRDIGLNSGIVPAIPGRLATMDSARSAPSPSRGQQTQPSLV